MYERIWRQRRRLFISFALFALAGYLAAGSLISDKIFLSLEAGVIGTAVTALMLIALPDGRWFLFKLAVLAPVIAFLYSAFPPPVAIGAALAGIFFLPSQPWFLDRIRLPGIIKARSETPVSLEKSTVWARLFPHETNEHWDPYLRGIRPGRSPNTFFFVYEAFSRSGELQVPIKVFDVESGVHFKTRDLSQPDAAEGGPVIVSSHFLESSGDGTVLTVMEAAWRPMLWTAFSQWLDDYLGDHTDRIAALLEGRRDWSLKGASLKTLTEAARPGGFQVFQRG